MNQKFYKIVTFLKTQLNVRIISVYTRKSFCIFLLCVDLNGLFFMINVKSYNISIDQDDVDIKTSVLKLLDSSEVASIHSSMKYYEQFLSMFPKFREKLIYHIDDFLILNSNNVYKILRDSSYKGYYNVLFKFNLEYLYDNKFNFSSEIYSFQDDMMRKLKELSSNSLSENISTAKFSSYFTNHHETILMRSLELQHFQNLYTSINSFNTKLKKDLKLLDNYTSNTHINLYDTNKNIQEKIKIKQKMKNMDALKNEVIDKMVCVFFQMMHKMVVYLFYKNEVDKKYISLESNYLDFVEKFD